MRVSLGLLHQARSCAEASGGSGPGQGISAGPLRALGTVLARYREECASTAILHYGTSSSVWLGTGCRIHRGVGGNHLAQEFASVLNLVFIHERVKVGN